MRGEFSSEFAKESFSKKSGPEHEKFLKELKRIGYIVAYRILQNQDAAEDAVQEAMVKVLQHVDQFDSRLDARFESWFMKIVQNASLSYLKKLRHHPDYKGESLDLELETGGQIEKPYADKKVYSINQTIAKLDAEKISEILTPEEVELYNLIYKQDLRPKEVAENLGVGTAVVAGRLQRMREKLRDTFSPDTSVFEREDPIEKMPKEDLAQRLVELRPADATLIEAKYIRGLSNSEILKKFKVAPSSFRSSIFRARKVFFGKRPYPKKRQN